MPTDYGWAIALAHPGIPLSLDVNVNDMTVPLASAS